MVLERVVPSQVLTFSRDVEGHDSYVCRQPQKGRVVGWYRMVVVGF